MYSIEFLDKAKQFLKKLDKSAAERIIEKIEKLQENPVPSDAVFIGRENGHKVFRGRVGAYRYLYMLKDSEKKILVTKVDKRHRVYD